MIVRFKTAIVRGCQLRALAQHPLNPGELLQTKRAVYLGKPAAEAGFVVLKPVTPVTATLIPQASNGCCKLAGISDHRAAFACCNYLVGIKRNNPNVTKRSCLAPVALCPEGLTSILYYSQGMAPGKFDRFLGWTRKTKRVDQYDGLGLGAESLFERCWSQVKRLRIDVHKDRHSPFRKDSVRDGHEAEGRHDDFVAVTYPQSPERQL